MPKVGKGTIIGEIQDSIETAKTFTLSWDELRSFREKFPVLRDRDEFEIKF